MTWFTEYWTPEFEEGQRVVNEDGEIGQIVEVQEWDRSYPYRVRFGKRLCWYSESRLVAV